MSAQKSVAELDVNQLRHDLYNATVLTIERRRDELMVIRVRPDRGVAPYLAGQFTVLGLGYWEPRAEGCQDEGQLEPKKLRRLVKRAYSISSPMLDGNGNVVGVQDAEFFELYITLVRRAEHAPALTPRLFALEPGSRIFCDPKSHGRYTLHGIHRDATVVFAGTGTGEAPHNAMAAQLLKTGHRGPIVNAACVRWKRDLGYLETHRRLEQQFENYHYAALTTREPENLDESHPGFVGKQYLQDYFAAGGLERDFGVALEPDHSHVFLCGNPSMIGAPIRSHDPNNRFPKPMGMVEILTKRGFVIDRPHHQGNLYYETYW